MSGETVVQIAVIMACYNRKEATLTCLQRLYEAALAAAAEVEVYLCDDGSTDGTAAAVHEKFPSVHIETTKNLYWAAGMHVVEEAVRAGGREFEYLFWLNDDVKLDKTALVSLLGAARLFPNSIVVGATRSELTSEVNYSGLNRGGHHPLNYVRVEPNTSAIKVQTFNGNAVLIPKKINDAVGLIDGEFSHAFADIDYGLRAVAKGYEVRLHPGTVGTCRDNESPPQLTIGAEWRRFLETKGGGNPSSTGRFLQRHAGRMWPIYFTSTYALWWIRAIFRHLPPRINKTNFGARK